LSDVIYYTENDQPVKSYLANINSFMFI